MSDTLYQNVTELVNQYNAKLIEHGIEIIMHRRSFKEDVEPFNYQSQHSLLNLLEYIFINKRIEEKSITIPLIIINCSFYRSALFQKQSPTKTTVRNMLF